LILVRHGIGDRGGEIKGSSDRSFGLVFTVVFVVIGLWPLLDGVTMPRWWALPIAMAFLVASFAKPSVLAPLNRLWTKFGLLLHRIINPVVLGILFYLMVTPIGVVRRLLGKDGLDRQLEPKKDSYWVTREPPGPPPESMNQQF
jgi:hypothetical protein